MLRGQLCEPLRTLVREAEVRAADVHIDQAIGLKLLNAGAVIVWPPALEQETLFTLST